jgi:hypothetical protein
VICFVFVVFGVGICSNSVLCLLYLVLRTVLTV